ncbi:hypothetical protein R70723_26335 [Paenibacillus sp. FSL R7-0273]|uniref:hypothetical protein n=1 Tax=Paenibacillus sp. FSL R7-0273 TaxID=1536772 RepID=UPI0004F655D9|nr:hypothetical protein [Paenibacillus sp. FSL R7-0273]AIQ49027.1 hypothetical protein R70723_26335 [Paenibacillus sp. FSL R7-0273]OMF90585.1 hypothetical protein BK144_17390 [Paenibacillus sp. FSL R7-0273]
MPTKKPVLPLLIMLAASLSLSACSRTESGGAENRHFHTLAEEQIVEPQYFPDDLPIPEGAGITFTEGELVDGKKSSMLIYETEQTMAALGTTYMKYIADKALESGTQIVDKNNILISGKAPGSYSYSIIGSSSAANPGGAEIIVTWIEN